MSGGICREPMSGAPGEPAAAPQASSQVKATTATVRSIVKRALGDPIVDGADLLVGQKGRPAERHTRSERHACVDLLEHDARARLAGDGDAGAAVESARAKPLIRRDVEA